MYLCSVGCRLGMVRIPHGSAWNEGKARYADTHAYDRGRGSLTTPIHFVPYQQRDDAYLIILGVDGKVEWHGHREFQDQDYLGLQQRVCAPSGTARTWGVFPYTHTLMTARRILASSNRKTVTLTCYINRDVMPRPS
jgi:hypothetical protein